MTRNCTRGFPGAIADRYDLMKTPWIVESLPHMFGSPITILTGYASARRCYLTSFKSPFGLVGQCCGYDVMLRGIQDLQAAC